MITKTKLLGSLGIAYILMSCVQAQATLIVFQDGLNGYTGTQDTYISAQNNQQERNYGTAVQLKLRAGSTPINILLSFNLDSLPDDVCIDSATLSLYKLNPTVDPIVSVYKILSGPWSEGNGGAATLGDVDWNHRIHGSPPGIPNVSWNTPGLGAGTDYEIPASDSENLTINGWYDWDVTSIVKDWYGEGDPNYGFVLKAAGDSILQQFASSERSNQARRPKLTINYHEGCPVPEPASLSLLGLGLLGLVRLRKKRS